MTSKTRAVERRNPKDWTPEMRKHAMTRLHDENCMFLDFRDGCVLLNISKSSGYEKANAGELPGAERSLRGPQTNKYWQFRRIPLKKYLYGEE